MYKLLILTFFCLVTINLNGQSCFTSWGYMQTIEANNSSTAINDYQVRLELNTEGLISEGKLKSKGDDLRFKDQNGNILPYWIEDGSIGTLNTVIWVRVNSLSTGTSEIYMFYGNASAVEQSNGNNTFLFFEDFNQSFVDPAKWDTSCNTAGSSMSFSNGEITLKAGEDNLSTNRVTLKSNAQVSTPSLIEAKVTSVAGSGKAITGIQNTTGDGVGIGITPNINSGYIKTYSNSCFDDGINSSGLTVNGSNLWSLNVNSNNVVGKIGGSTLNTLGVTTSSQTNIVLGSSENTTSISLDYIYARKYASNDITTTFKSENILPKFIDIEAEYCEGEDLYLTVPNIEGASYQWFHNNVPIATSREHIISNLTALKSGDYKVNIGLADGCNVVLTKSISITESTVSGQLTGARSVCSDDGTPYQLSLNNNVGDIKYWEYSLSGADPWVKVDNTTGIQNFQNLQHDTYFRAFVKNGSCNGEYSNIVKIEVTAAVVPGRLIGVKTQCSGDNSGRLNLVNYLGMIEQWESSADNIAYDPIANTNSYLDFSRLQNTTYYRVKVSNGNCSSIYSNVVEVTIEDAPDVTFNTTEVCFSENTLFTPTSISSAYAYSWDFGDGKSSSAMRPTYRYENPGKFNATLTITTENACSYSFSKEVNVKFIPTADFEVTEVCVGSETIFDDRTLYFGTQELNYSWDFGDGITSIEQHPTHIYQNSGEYIVTQTVSTLDGCFHAIQKTIQAYSIPTIDFTVDDICLGEKLRVKNLSNKEGDVEYTWTIDDASNTTITGFEPDFDINISKKYVITLYAITENGCTNSLMKSVNVFPLPDVSFNADQVCLGEVTNFTNTTVVDNTIFESSIFHQWDFGDGNISYDESPSHIYEASGLYLVKLISTTEEGCAHEMSKHVRVWDQPVATFTNENSCLGKPISFTNQSSIGSGTLTCEWDFGDGNSSNGFNPIHTYLSSGIFEVSLTITSINGCQDTFKKNVEVYNQPIALFEQESVCIGNTMVFENKSYAIIEGSNIILPPNFNYEWNFGDDNISTEISPSHIYQEAGNYTVTLKISNTEGCTADFVKVVNVAPEPIVSFSAEEVCIGNATEFINTTQISNGNLSYYWDYGDGNFSTEKSPSHEYINSGKYLVTLLVTSDQGCINEITNEIEVAPEPIVSFDVENVCHGEEMFFINSSTIESGEIVSYLWNFGDGTNSIDENPSKIYLESGEYTVTLQLISDKGCLKQEEKTILVKEVPVSNFSVINACLGDENIFEDLSTSTIGSLEYFWDFGDGQISYEENPIHTYHEVGEYEVIHTVTTSEGCAHTIQKSAKVFSIPVLDFTVDDICLGENLNVRNLSGGDSEINYTWTINDENNTSVTSFEPNFDITVSRSYTIRLDAVSKNGCVNSISKNVDVYPNPLTDFEADSVCVGQITNFTNHTSIDNSIFDSNLNYHWDFGDGNSSIEENPTHEYESTGLYLVKLTATTNEGCAHEINKYVRVWDQPISAFTNGNSCLGQSISFTNQSSTGSGVLTYYWDFDDGTESDALNPSHTYTVSGTYEVNLTVTNTNGCQHNSKRLIQIYEQPVALFTQEAVCIGNPIVFDNLSYAEIEGQEVVLPPGFNYEWNFGDDNFSTEVSPSHSYNLAGNYTVTLIVRNNEGCSSSFSTVVTVNPEPVAKFSFNTVCLGSFTQFTNESQIQNGDFSYHWDFGEGNTSIVAHPQHEYSLSGSYTVKLTVTSGEGCVDEVEKVVIVNPLPLTAFEVSNVCDGEEMSFENTSTIESGNIVNYLWNFGDGTNSIDTHPKNIYLNAGEYKVILKTTSEYGCETTTERVVIVREVPVPDFTITNACFGEENVFTDQSWNYEESIAYYWDFGDGNTSTSMSPSHLYDASGEYLVRLTVIANEGCTDFMEKKAIVYEIPEVKVSEDVEISQGFTTQLIAEGGYSYQWLPAESLDNSTVANPIAQPSETTTYTVRVTDKYGCVSFGEVTVSIKDDYRLFPANIVTPDNNGFNDTWIIENIESYPEATVKIFNRLGHSVYQTSHYQNDWGGTNGTDILPDGTYYYVITFKDSNKVYKGALTILRNGNNNETTNLSN